MTMPDFGSELRAYELSLPREQRKRLGQFFTEPAVARLLAALAIRQPSARVLDTMAGHGNLLDAAAERLDLIGARATLFGVEIDPDTARLCQTRLATSASEHRQRGATVTCGDAFNPEIWEELGAAYGFDLVIGNPPYVRYQTTKGGRDEVRDGLREIARRFSPEQEREAWQSLIDGYSGLADLSVPSWMLCGLLCKPGGTLALVVPRTWLNRDYSRIVQYLQLRFFEPLVLVEEDGVGWFQDALVPTTLIVSRRFSADRSSVPLQDRDYGDRAMARVRVPPAAGSAQSLVSAAFSGGDPEADFAAWAADPDALPNDQLARHRESLAESRSRLLSLIGSESWFRRSEGSAAARSIPTVLESAALVPAAVAQAIRLPERPNLVTLASAGIQVGQGLRSGCNGFFYVDELPSDDPQTVTVRTSELFHARCIEVPRAALRPVLRRQSEVQGFSVQPDYLPGRILDLRHWLLPEDPETEGQLFTTSTARRMPEPLAAYVRAAAATSVGRNGHSALIPTLSAVAPNERPGGAGLARRWYMLPDFAPRHLPLLFVPRVNDGTPWFVRNAAEPVIIDANFSTIHDKGVALSVSALHAVLNSSWCRACCEALGSPMGGGALKLEATHLRSLPIPRPDAANWERLDRLGQELLTQRPAEAQGTLRRIDEVTAVAVLGGEDATGAAAAAACDALTSLLHSLRQQRQRKGGTRA